MMSKLTPEGQSLIREELRRLRVRHLAMTATLSVLGFAVSLFAVVPATLRFFDEYVRGKVLEAKGNTDDITQRVRVEIDNITHTQAALGVALSEARRTTDELKAIVDPKTLAILSEVSKRITELDERLKAFESAIDPTSALKIFDTVRLSAEIRERESLKKNLEAVIAAEKLERTTERDSVGKRMAAIESNNSKLLWWIIGSGGTVAAGWHAQRSRDVGGMPMALHGHGELALLAAAFMAIQSSGHGTRRQPVPPSVELLLRGTHHGEVFANR